MNEGGNKKNRVEVQVADPNLIIKKQALQKRMNRNPKTPFEEIFKYNNLIRPWVRKAFFFTRSPPSKLLIVEHPHVDEFVDRLSCGFGFPTLLGHHICPLLGIAFGHLG